MIRVVAAVIEHKGRLLICQRRARGTLGLRWEFPGGKMRASESPRAALARELREELGIAVKIGARICRTCHRYAEHADTLEIQFFAAAHPRPAPRNLVFERIAWAHRAELPRYDFLPADRLLISRLARGEFSAAFARLSPAASA